MCLNGSFNITQKGHPISERTLELNMSCHPPTTSGYGARTVQISHTGQTTHKELLNMSCHPPTTVTSGYGARTVDLSERPNHSQRACLGQGENEVGNIISGTDRTVETQSRVLVPYDRPANWNSHWNFLWLHPKVSGPFFRAPGPPPEKVVGMGFGGLTSPSWQTHFED